VTDASKEGAAAGAAGPGAGDPLPLRGVRVIDVGTRISAPFCAGLLGEMGADVIKIEDPHGGDFMRTIGPVVPADEPGSEATTGAGGEGGYSMWWAVEGRGRKGITLDLRKPAGQELFRRLAGKADVVCENFRPGTMEGWGIGPDDCDRRLVWARISVFGQDGPYAGRTGLDRMGIAYGGLLHLTGYPDRPPVRPGLSISDYMTGTFAAGAVASMLYRRDEPGGTGRGGVVDAYLCGSVLRVLEWTLAAQSRLGVTRQREGNRMAMSAPLDNYPTADGAYVCIVAGSNTNFRRLCAAMGKPAMADDPQWATLALRAARSEEINDLVASWTLSLTAAEVEQACISHEVPVATAYSAVDILADPHFVARGDFVSVDDPVAGAHLQQAPFPRLDGRRPVSPCPAPLLGEHNEEIWCGLVGLTSSELAEQRSSGVI
jgi:crotonobetainyl-CoA:carnitine CoA-transferase CaiB-like acyl-CoA transferase